jgi:MinD-like ATPase involved in chromosome partitioning or flagellar assembly
MDERASLGAREDGGVPVERTVPLIPPASPTTTEPRSSPEADPQQPEASIVTEARPGHDQRPQREATPVGRPARTPRWRLLARRQAIDAKRQEWIADARVPLASPVRAVVAAPKGGVGKTTVALVLAERLAALRADRVGVLDAQPLGGTAGLRVAGQRGLGLPALLGELEDVAGDGSYTAWSRWATIEHETRVTVFGRAEPLEGAELSIDAYRQLAGGLARQWPIVIVDTGAPEGRSALQVAAVESADVLVVVCGPGQPTVAATAGWMRDIRIPPARRVGVVAPLTGGDTEEAMGLMASTCGSVVRMPVDPALAAESAVPLLPSARTVTRDAATELAGMVMRASQSLTRE